MELKHETKKSKIFELCTLLIVPYGIETLLFYIRPSGSLAF